MLLKSMYTKTFFLFAALVFSSFLANAQKCSLNIGGTDSNIIVEIFQLNEEQQVTMQEIKEELALETGQIDAAIQKLLKEHPQSTQEELMVLAKKYRELQLNMVNTVLDADKKLLTTFNPKQYQRYLALCKEALREPIQIAPVPIKNVPDPE
ncbi:MAG: hypothetical protein MUO53_12530 [Maribacter sp.]|nr:hypothetical protein [Maribacter sp.]